MPCYRVNPRLADEEMLRELSLSECKVYLWLAARGGYVDASEREAAERVGLSRGAFRAARVALETRGLVEEGEGVQMSTWPGFETCSATAKPTNLVSLFDEVDESSGTLEVPPDAFQQVYQAWLEHGFVAHRSLTDKMRRAIRTTLKEHTLEDILAAIENYGTVVESKDHMFSYRGWTLDHFLRRGVSRFVPMADPLHNMRDTQLKRGVGERTSKYADWGKG